MAAVSGAGEAFDATAQAPGLRGLPGQSYAQDHDWLHASEGDRAGQAGGLREAEREVAALLAISKALRAWESFERGSEHLLCGLATALDLQAGALWLRHGEVLVARAIWSDPSVDRAKIERALGALRIPAGVGIPGCAWELRVPVDQANSAACESSPPRQVTVADLRPAVGLPALAGEEVLGVIELYSYTHFTLGEHLMEVLIAAGHAVGAFFAHRRGELSLSPLSGREREVLTLAAQGMSGRKIAEQLSISPATVKTHFERACAKLGVAGRTAAVAHALRTGLIA
jgi:DNA-binding CsgD family transcriptional regulator